MNSYLKWVGGKAQLSSDLIKLFPEEVNRYFEPFLGSASMFLSYFDFLDQPDIFSESSLFPEAYLNDSNPHLINCHVNVAYLSDIIAAKLIKYERNHMKDPEVFYKKIRKEVTNKNKDPFARALDFIYINKTCFNGIWRVNSKGEYNVPWNKKTSVKLNSGNLFKSSELMKNASFFNKDFEDFIRFYDIRKGDFFFVDPPYIPLSITSNFSSYTEDGWDHTKDNLRLRDCLHHIDNLGGKFMMTNSSSKYTIEIFQGWNTRYIKAHRFVKALKNKEKRHKVNEAIITNY